MSSEMFEKDNLSIYLRELGKTYRKMYGAYPAEIILIGGASVLINYGFRESTIDADAIILAQTNMKDAINKVGNQFNLPYNWLNTDFMRTDSFSARLIEKAKPFRTFSNYLHVKTISREYLVVMKLKAFRSYKRDLSDIVGIIKEENDKETPIKISDIKKATIELYGSYDQLSVEARLFIEAVINHQNYSQLYSAIISIENKNKETLLEIDKLNSDIITEEIAESSLSMHSEIPNDENVNDITI